MRRIWATVVCSALLLGTSAARSDVIELWAPGDTVITMTRDGCEARCPVYSVIIFSDGTVIVEGQYYLRKAVLKKSEIPAEDVLKLVERFRDSGYFQLEDVYGYKGKGCTPFNDSSAATRTVITTIVTGGKGKSISHHTGCLGDVPDRLVALERQIDETAHTSRWLKGALRR